MDKGFCINCMKPTMEPVEIGERPWSYWVVKCKRCSMTGPTHIAGYQKCTSEDALKEWDVIVDKLNLHKNHPKPRVFIVTDTIGGCSGEHWHVVVAKSKEHAEELAHKEWSKVSAHAETRVEEILVDTEGVKDYGGYIE